jgi:hypothetical protein
MGHQQTFEELIQELREETPREDGARQSGDSNPAGSQAKTGDRDNVQQTEGTFRVRETRWECDCRNCGKSAAIGERW